MSSIGGFFSTIGKWSAIEHRLQSLEQLTHDNNEKLLTLLHTLHERILALEADKSRVDQKIDNILANVVTEAKAAATVAANTAAMASILGYAERFGRLEARLEASNGGPPQLK
jgi:hypothetical protein